MPNSSLFFAEEKIIDSATSTFNKIDKLSKEDIKNAYKSIFKSYKSLYKQFRRLIKLSDKQQLKLNSLNEALEIRKHFIKKIFGRYLSEDIVATLLETPDGLKLGGERRVVTIMMTDLRGFTALCETLSPENVLKIINTYLEVISEVVLKYNGTIDEIIGDGLFIIFGAPIQKSDDAIRSVACAIDMQLAMITVNQRIQKMGFPELELGIGINTGEVVVGNIGSQFRTKYGLIGSNVNLTARIESYTIGGQILISENTLKACGDTVQVNNTFEVLPKGLAKPINIYDINGIKAPYHLFLQKQKDEMFTLETPLPVLLYLIKQKHVCDDALHGVIIKLNKASCIIECEIRLEMLSNIKMTLFDENNNPVSQELYAKINKNMTNHSTHYKIHFTSIPQEARNFFNGVMSKI